MIIILSSTEAEFVALVLSVEEFNWLMNLIEETGFNYDLRIVHCDNQGALKIIRNEGIRKIEFLRAWEGVVISMCTIKGI